MRKLLWILPIIGLGACSQNAVDGAVVASGLSAAQQEQVQGVCAAAAPLLAVATNPGVPTSVSSVATDAAAYCKGVSGPSAMPATTDSNTPSWLAGVLKDTEAAAQVAGVVLPLLGIAL